ncbi:MAG: hypothetical protein IJD81_02040 [Oscillospiraceae bacterium]|nr:hypothetical protein [Oscillospiraceae bacterium]
MKGKYWFNIEPVSKDVQIIFEYKEYQFINDVIHLCNIDELKSIINSIKKHIEDGRVYSYAKEYLSIFITYNCCCIEYELPNQSHTCFIDCNKMAEILEKYVDKYEHCEDIFKF